MDIQSIQQSQAIQLTLGQATKTTKATNGSFLTMFNSLQGSSSQLADMWKSSFEKNGDTLFMSISEQETQSVSEYDEDGNAIEKNKGKR